MPPRQPPRQAPFPPLTVVAIHLGAPRNPQLWEVDSVRALAGKGLEGDRYFFADGAEPGRALTLVEEECLAACANAPMMMPMTLTLRLVFESLPECHHLIWLVDATC